MDDILDDEINYVDDETNYVNLELFLASKGQRIANYFLDQVGIYLLAFSLMLFLEDSNFDNLSGAQTFWFFLSMLSYWVLSEYFFGKTPAKFLTGTKVVTKFGDKPSLLTIIGRTICRLIPFDQFSFLGRRTIGWHDSLSGTRVVRDEYKSEEDYV